MLLVVSNSGNNGNPGTPESPLQTGTFALSIASYGDKIAFRAGTYIEDLMANLIPFPDGVTLESYNNENACLQGSIGLYDVTDVTVRGLEIDATGKDHCVIFSGAHNCLLENSRLHHSLSDCIQTGNNLGSNQITIRNNWIHDSGQAGEEGFAKHGIYASAMLADDLVIVERNWFYNHHGDFNTWAIHCYTGVGPGLGKLIIRRNRVFDSIGGILVTDINDADVYSNLVYRCTSGITVSLFGGEGDGAKVYNNTVFDCSEQAGLNGGTNSRWRNNIFFGNGSNAITNTGSGMIASNNRTTDPNFYDSSTGDFRLIDGSDAIYAGIAVAEDFTDFDGNPWNNPPSCGAHEFVSLLGGTIWWVGKSGDDDNNTGLSSNSRFLTINKAASMMSGGDTIIIGDGTYVEFLRNVIPSGSEENPTIIRAEHRNQVIMRPDSWFYVFEFTQSASHIVIDGIVANGQDFPLGGVCYYMSADVGIISYITIKNGKSIFSGGAGQPEGGWGCQIGAHANVAGHHHVTIQNMEFSGAQDGGSQLGGYGIYLSAHHCLIENNWFHDNEGYQLHTYTSSQVGITDNVIRNNFFDARGAIQQSCCLLSGSLRTKFYNNVLWGHPSGSGLDITYSATDTEVYHNTIVGNAHYAVRILDLVNNPVNAIIRKNICYGNGFGTIIDQVGGNTIDTNFFTDPMFVDAANGDFHLRLGSPARGATPLLSSVLLDYDSISRSNPTSYGAFELAEGPVGGGSGGSEDPGTGVVDEEVDDPDNNTPAPTPPPPPDPGAQLSPEPPTTASLSRWHVLCRIYPYSGPRNLSHRNVIHPTRFYEGKVQNWGMIDRSIPCPSGLPQVSDGKIRVLDPDFVLRDLMTSESLRGKYIDIKLVQERHSESAVAPMRFVIKNHKRGPGYVEIEFRDRTFWWLDEIIPAVITRENYPDLQGPENQFLNIINGDNISPPENPQGQIPCPYIGWDVLVGDRFAVAWHPIEDVVTLYRMQPGEGIFTVVDPGEFNITVDPRTFVEYPSSLVFQPTYVDFLVKQPDGTLITADVKGVPGFAPGVGDWNGIPSSPNYEDQRNPIRHFINMIFLIMYKISEDQTIWDGVELAALLARCETMIQDSSSSTGFLPLRCDGALTRSMTVREWLGIFLPSFDFDMYQKRSNGKLTLNFTGETDPDRPVFTHRYHIMKRSFEETMAAPTANQAIYRSKLNYVTQKWGAQNVYDNVDDQLAGGTLDVDSAGVEELDSVGQPIKIPQVETDTVGFHYVRDQATADFIIAHRMGYLALGSYRQKWSMPLPEVLDDVELTKQVGITTPYGTALGGYTNKEVKIIGETLNLDGMILTVRSILKDPQPLVTPTIVPVEASPVTGEVALQGTLEQLVLEGCGVVDGSWVHNTTVGPFHGPGLTEWFGTFVLAGRLVVVRSNDNMESWNVMDDVQTAPGTAIGSTETHESGDDFLVFTQQLNGRVAYNRFNRVSLTWEAIDKQVIASATIAGGVEGCTVSGCRLSTGELGVLYETDIENVSGNQQRCGFRISSDDGDTWGAEEQVGHWGQAISDVPSRAMPTNAGQVLFNFGNATTPFFGHIFCQTRTAAGSLSAITQIREGGGLSQIQNGRCAGVYHCFLDSGAYKIAVPYRLLTELHYAIFQAGDNMTPSVGVSQMTGAPTIFMGVATGADYAMGVFSELNGVLSIIGEFFTNTNGAFMWHKSATSPFTVFSPATQHADKCGPTLDATTSGQCIGAKVLTIGGVDYLATFQGANAQVTLVQANLRPLSELPLDAGYDLTTWAAECT